MFNGMFEEFTGRGMAVVIGVVLGGALGWLSARWKRYQERQSILRGDARDTVVIHHHIVETQTNSEGRKVAKTLRLRSLGQSEVSRVVPNGHLASELLRRALHVTSRDTLISMEGSSGSYLLETLTNFVCDRVANEPFDHELYVMAPCCEPAGIVEHQPITILLIAEKELGLFENWPDCRDVRVEHGSDGIRLLTLMELARRHKREQQKITELRQAGQRTKYVETMYLLDLALDKRSAQSPTREVPWGRYEGVLKGLGVE